jgi:small subunit ribosomal protein S18
MPRQNSNSFGSEKREKREPRRGSGKRKACRFCADKDLIIDYKMVKLLSDFITDRCRLVARRTTGNCLFHQARVVEAVSRARHLALMPYAVSHVVRD